MSLTELDDGLVRRMAIGAVFSDFGGKIHSVGFHRTDDLLVTSSEDDSLRLFDIANAKQLKITYYKKHGTDRVCFTHHPSSLICSSRYNLLSTGESLRYLSMYDNRILRYFKGHKDRVVSLCMSPINDSFISGSLDRSVRLWDLRVNACQGILHLRGRPAVQYDQQGLVFAIAIEGGAVKLFDSRCYDKGPFDTFLVGGDTAEVNDIKFSNDGKSMLLTTTNNNMYVLDAYHGEKKCGFSLEPSQGTSIEATFTPDGKYVLSGSGDGTLNAWNIENPSEVARWENNIGVVSCLKWAPRRAMFVAASTVLTFWIPNDCEPPAPADSHSDQQPFQYPTFIDGLRDLNDWLTMVHLFAVLPASDREKFEVKRVHNCRRLSHEWQAYISRCHALRKVFVSVKGTMKFVEYFLLNETLVIGLIG